MASPFEPFGGFPGSASTEAHRSESPASVTCAVLTISDTRSKEDDRSGELIRQYLGWRGHRVAAYAIVPDEAPAIERSLRAWIDDERIEAILTNGGTGLAGRDVTYEAITGLFERRIDGSGELFRMLSYAEIGAAAMLSRCTAGIAHGTVIFAMPGSPNAVRLAMEKLIGPELGHVIREVARQRPSG